MFANCSTETSRVPEAVRRVEPTIVRVLAVNELMTSATCVDLAGETTLNEGLCKEDDWTGMDGRDAATMIVWRLIRQVLGQRHQTLHQMSHDEPSASSQSGRSFPDR
jgi:hypothetical protein